MGRKETMLKKLFAKKKEVRTYDRENEKPVIRRSICTGEATAGFQNLHTRNFREVMLVNTREEMQEFLDLYGLEEIPETIY